MINRKEDRDYKKGVSKYYPTTMQEALNRIYEMVPKKIPMEIIQVVELHFQRF